MNRIANKMEVENKRLRVRSSFVPEDKTALARSLKITSIDEADEDTASKLPTPSPQASSKFFDSDDDELSSK